MNNDRLNELIAAEERLTSCGCGGVCLSCQAEPRPSTESEREEFELELAALGAIFPVTT